MNKAMAMAMVLLVGGLAQVAHAENSDSVELLTTLGLKSYTCKLTVETTDSWNDRYDLSVNVIAADQRDAVKLCMIKVNAAPISKEGKETLVGVSPSSNRQIIIDKISIN